MSSSACEPIESVIEPDLEHKSPNEDTRSYVIQEELSSAFAQYENALRILDDKISHGELTCAATARLRRSAFIFQYVIENSKTFEGPEQTALTLAAQREWDEQKNTIFSKMFSELRLEEYRKSKEEAEKEQCDFVDDTEDDVLDLLEEKKERKFVSKKDFIIAATERILRENGSAITRKVAAQKATREWDTSLENPKFRREILNTVNCTILAFQSVLNAPEEHQHLLMQEMVMRCGRVLSTFCEDISKLSPEDIIRKLEEFKESIENL